MCVLRALCFMLILVSSQMVCAHGVKNTSASIEIRPNGLVELQIQFHFVDVLNHIGKDTDLVSIAAIKPKQFQVLYQTVQQLFDKGLVVTYGKKELALNERYPSTEQALELTKREFLEKTYLSDKSIPYTYSDRRFYQVFSFDFKLPKNSEIKDIKVSLSKELGEVNLTLSQSLTCHLNEVTNWLVYPRPRSGCH